MKKLLQMKTMLLLCALIVGSGSVWAADKTITLDYNSFGLSGSYAKKTATVDGIGFTVDQGFKGTGVNANAIQMNSTKGTGTLYNTTAIAGLKSVTVNVMNGDKTYTITSGTSQNPTTNTQTGSSTATYNVTSGDEFFQLRVSGASYFSSIVITYEEDSRAEAGLAYTPISTTLELGEALTQPTFSNPHDLTVEFESNNTSVATVTDEGTISLAGAVGTAVITASSEGTLEYKDGEATFTITVNRKTSTLEVADDFSMKAGTEVVIDDGIYVTNSDGDVALTSSDATVVKIEDGKLKALKGGTATISVSVAQSSTYESTSDTFVITVEENASVTPVGQGAGNGFMRISSAEELIDGEYLIVYESGKQVFKGSLETLDAATNGLTLDEIPNGVIAVTDELKGMTFTYDAENKTLKSKSGYYIGNTANSNALSSSKTISYTNDISFTGTNADIVGSGGAYLRYNSASNQNRFRYYKSESYTNQQAIQLYRLCESNSFDVEIPAAGWRTLVSAKNVSLPSGVKAYTVTEASDDAVTLTEVASIKANNPYLLNGASGDCTLTLIDTDPVEPTGNLLEISTATTGNGEYVLANKSHGVGFYLWNGGYMGAGRVYLPSAVVTNAREFFGFDFTDITGISQVGNEELKIGNVYNLNGQRVAQPTKGLYIVNGKKVIIK